MKTPKGKMARIYPFKYLTFGGIINDSPAAKNSIIIVSSTNSLFSIYNIRAIYDNRKIQFMFKFLLLLMVYKITGFFEFCQISYIKPVRLVVCKSINIRVFSDLQIGIYYGKFFFCREMFKNGRL